MIKGAESGKLYPILKEESEGEITVGDPTAINAIADALGVNNYLKSINLMGNTLGPAGGKVIAAALRDSNSLNSIDVGFNNFDRPTALELLAAMKGKDMVSIGMAYCSLGVEGAKIVAEMASVMGSLTQVLAFFPHFLHMRNLDLQLNLSVQPHARAVDRLLCSVQVDLRDNGLGPEGAKALGPAIAVSNSLTSVE